jgi:hypothetical protein
MKLRKYIAPLLLSIIAILLLFGAGKCFGQDTLTPKKHYFPLQRNILIVESTQTNSWFPPQAGYFKVRHRVQVVTRTNNTKERGHIEFISDSSIFLNGREIKLKDIVTIKKIRGEELSIVGGSLTSIGLGLSIYYGIKSGQVNTYADDSYAWESLGFAGGTLITGICTLVGIIQVASARKYHMDYGWRFDVKPDIFAQPGMMKFPGKSDTVNGSTPFKPGNTMNMPTPFPQKKKKETGK